MVIGICIMDELIKYLKDTLGIEAEIKPLKSERLKALPVYIAESYSFNIVRLYRQDILLVVVNHSFTTESLRKHLEIIRAAFEMISVFVIHQLESYNRLRLIEKKIPFIIPGKQMYLPDLLIDLKEFGVNPKVPVKIMQPATQLLLLYHLQVESLEGINLKGIAEKLSYNPMTITRAAYYLYNMSICELRGTKDKHLHFNSAGKALWERVEPLMNNPVKKSYHFSGWVKEENLYRTNNNALAHYSDLNDDVIDYFAVRPGYLRFLVGTNLHRSGPLEGNICIEEWKYDPSFLTKDKYVDPLSLYLCFRKKPDERIEMALEQIINNMVW